MTRALLTDREKEVLAGEATDVKHPDKYQSNTRARIRDRLEKVDEDLEILEEHEPDLAAELRTIICEGSEQAKLHDVLNDIQNEIRELRDDINSD